MAVKHTCDNTGHTEEEVAVIRLDAKPIGGWNLTKAAVIDLCADCWGDLVYRVEKKED